MFRAASEPPTDEMASTCGWSIRASTVSLAPCTTLTTPSGKPASEKNSARRMAESGVRWEGLRIKALPVAIARGANHSGIIMGKLNGVTAATTPRGSLCRATSTPGLTPSRVSPFISVVMEAASSTTSMPRQISPFDSSTCLPFSRVQSSASSSMFSSSKTWSLNILLDLHVNRAAPDKVLEHLHGYDSSLAFVSFTFPVKRIIQTIGSRAKDKGIQGDRVRWTASRAYRDPEADVNI